MRDLLPLVALAVGSIALAAYIVMPPAPPEPAAESCQPYRAALARECSPLVVDWERLECDRRGLPRLGATIGEGR